MKRGLTNSDDESSPNSQQLTKFSRGNTNNGRKLTWQLESGARETESPSSHLINKLKGHQSTPYPKRQLKQLQESTGDDVSSSTVEEVIERRNPMFLVRLHALNRSFMSWVDIHFSKGYDYDFTPVCNDYIRFINNLKASYPIENRTQDQQTAELASTNHVDKISTSNNALNETSPMKSRTNLLPLNSNTLINTPTPNPGEKGYKSTPYPKHLLKQAASQAQNDSPFGGLSKSSKSIASSESSPAKFETCTSVAGQQASSTASNFNFMSQTPFASAKNDDEKPKLEFPFPTSSSLSTNSQSLFKFGTTTSQPSNTNASGLTNAVNKNLFAVNKPQESVTSSSNSLFNLPAIQSVKPIDSNFFSPDNIFKSQLDPQATTIKPNNSNNNPLIGQSNQSNLNETQNSTIQNDDDENYVPPKPEVAQVEENACYSVKCKLFLKKKEQYVEKGIGTVYIKETTEDAGNQLLIRADNSLGTVLLNIRLKKTLPITPTKNGLLLSVPNPQSQASDANQKKRDNKDDPPSDTSTFYIRLKNNDLRDELNSFIKKYSV